MHPGSKDQKSTDKNSTTSREELARATEAKLFAGLMKTKFPMQPEPDELPPGMSDARGKAKG